MLTSQVSIVVQRNQATVFAYISDLERHHEWAAQKLRIEPIGPASNALGTEFDSMGVQLRVKLHDTVRITEYEPPERFAYESDGDLGDYVHFFRLEPAGDVTNVTYGASFLRGPLYQRILAYPIWPLVPRGLRDDLKRIKGRLEETRTSR